LKTLSKLHEPFALKIYNHVVWECNYQKHLFVCSSGSDEYGWWFSTDDDTYDPLSPSDVSKGYDESIELVKSTFVNQVIKH